MRAAALMQAIPQATEIDLYTELPASFFREELARPFRRIACALDCGCVQRDSTSVDIDATLERYADIDARRDALLPPLAERLRADGVDLVIADIPPLAFPLAQRAGLPSLAIGNFSWVDIYADYVVARPAYRPLLESMRADYAEAGALLRLAPGFGAALTGTVFELGIVCRPGHPQRPALARRLGLDPGKKWCLIYLGNYGFEGAHWERLGDFADWEFLGLYPLEGASPNYHRFEKDPSLRYADLTASVDLVLGKLGYGLVAETLTHGTPVLFVPRRDFAEHALLKEVVEDGGLGLEIPLEELKEMRMQAYLVRAAEMRQAPREAPGVSRFLRLLGWPVAG